MGYKRCYINTHLSYHSLCLLRGPPETSIGHRAKAIRYQHTSASDAHTKTKFPKGSVEMISKRQMKMLASGLIKSKNLDVMMEWSCEYHLTHETGTICSTRKSGF